MSQPRLYDWTPQLEVGLERIDREHQQFIEIMNALYAAIFRGDADAEVRRALERLDAYTAFHFATEERLFAATGYPEAEEHLARHATFVADLRRLQPGTESARTIITFMRDWLLGHITHADCKYAAWMKEHGFDDADALLRKAS